MVLRLTADLQTVVLLGLQKFTYTSGTHMYIHALHMLQMFMYKSGTHMYTHSLHTLQGFTYTSGTHTYHPLHTLLGHTYTHYTQMVCLDQSNTPCRIHTDTVAYIYCCNCATTYAKTQAGKWGTKLPVYTTPTHCMYLTQEREVIHYSQLGLNTVMPQLCTVLGEFCNCLQHRK